jgi:peptidoglycan/LPS O-acetylase OafA/YrhL
MHSNIYLKGLNSLRFFAAFFVIIQHGQISISKMGFERFSAATVFNKGADAVEFFYVLSGFLITYLLQLEIARSGTISIKKFYLRRMFRIWPLYFLLVAVGFIFLGLLYPRLTGQPFWDMPAWKPLVLYLCFLPNLAAVLFPMGMLFPLRTIGVEEQYYLFWAPLVKLFRKNLQLLIILFVGLSYIWYAIVVFHFLPLSQPMFDFLASQKFYAMATGALFSLVLYRYPDRYRKSIFAGRLSQWLVLLVILWFYFCGFPGVNEFALDVVMCLLYGLLILNCSLLPAPVVNLEKRGLVYLGTISYGLYSCHMLVDYFLRFFILKFHIEKKVGFNVLMPLYHILLLGGAIVVASLSYKYYESYFLRLKEKYA